MAFGRDRSYLTLALERFQGPLLRYVARILKDEERARDVGQDGFEQRRSGLGLVLGHGILPPF